LAPVIWTKNDTEAKVLLPYQIYSKDLWENCPIGWQLFFAKWQCTSLSMNIKTMSSVTWRWHVTCHSIFVAFQCVLFLTTYGSMRQLLHFPTILISRNTKPSHSQPPASIKPPWAKCWGA
jgi:hypothetical protein